MRAFAVWTGLVLAATACGTDAEPQTSGVTTSGAGGAGGASGAVGAAAAGTKAVPGAAGTLAAGSGAATAGAGAGAAGVSGAGAGGRSGSSAAAGSGGAGTAGVAGRAGSSSAGAGGRSGEGGTGGAAGGGGTTEKFSFFVTSLSGMIELSKSEQGFGGNLKFGEATGLAGADKICTTLAEKSMPASGAKGWHAFLSAAAGPVHAKDRIGKGPWYDRLGRLVANDLAGLLTERPTNADMAIRNDLPNERGEPNHTDTMQGMDDNHDTVTGSNAMGMYDSSSGNTCSDWTSTASSGDRGPMVGHSWPAQSGMSWIRAHNAPGCSPSVALTQTGGGSGTGIGNGGGYGGFYCFALKP